MFDVLGQWLGGEIRGGNIRDLPLPLLIDQMLGPMLIHMLLRLAKLETSVVEVPDIDTACDVFADLFVRVVANPIPTCGFVPDPQDARARNQA